MKKIFRFEEFIPAILWASIAVVLTIRQILLSTSDIFMFK